MNTIPTTSKDMRIPYTVVGGHKVNKISKYPATLSLLLINCGGRIYRNDTIMDLEKYNFDEIISIEGPGVSYDIEALSQKFPNVRFLLLHKEVSKGEQINIGIKEALGKYVFVLWNDMKIYSSVSSRLIEKIKDQDILCTVPLLQNHKLETIPSIQSPVFDKKKLRVINIQPSADGLASLFPFNYCGIYSKEKYILVGGYDCNIKNSYWQKMDFGFRSYMWGEKVKCNTSFRLSYLLDTPSENTTPEENYKIFYLKNLAVRFSGDSGIIPISRFLPYYFKTGGSIFLAVREFKEVKRWVKINKYRFKQDARSVTELWEADVI